MIRPSLDRIALRLLPTQEEKTSGGVVIPAMPQDIQMRNAPHKFGEVVAVGPLVRSDIRPGDVVAIAMDYRQDPRKYAPPLIRSMGEWLLLVHEETVCGVESPPDAVDGRCPRCGWDLSANWADDWRAHPTATCNARFDAQEREREDKAIAAIQEYRKAGVA